MTWLVAGNLAVKPLWFLFTTLVCMRALGPSGYGEFAAALALALVVAAFSDAGLSDYTVRRLAHAPDATEAASSLLALRTVLALSGIAATMGLGWSIGHRGTLLAALAGGAFYVGALRLVEYIRSYYRAFEVLRYESISIVLERLATIAGGMVGLTLAPGPAVLLAGMGIGTSLALIGNVVWVHHRLAPLRVRDIHLPSAWHALVDAFPLGVYGALSILFLNVGTVLLERLDGPAAAGTFGAAYRFVELTALLPTVVVAAVYPRLSALHAQQQQAEFLAVLRRAAAMVAAVALGIAPVVALAGPFMVRLLAPGDEFQGVGTVLAVVSWQIPAMALSAVFGAALMARGETRVLAVVLMAVVPFTAGINVLLIPTIGALGTATALVAGQVMAAVSFGVRLARSSPIYSHE